MSDHSGRSRRRGGVTPRKPTKSVVGDYARAGEGIDTCAVVLRPRTLRALDRLSALPFQGSDDRRLLQRGRGDARLIYFPSYGMVRFEGRCAAIQRDDADNHELADPVALLDVKRAAQEIVGDLCGELVDQAEAARLDIAADLTCSAADGLALLRVLRHARPPRAKWMVYENPGDRMPETVAFVTQKRGAILLRAYDKGLESSTAPRGERIRIERQVRLDRARRRRVENVDGSYLASHWASHLRGMSESARKATVGTSTTLTEELAKRVEEGTLTPARARSLLGAAYLLPKLEAGLEERTAQRWRSDLQREGLLPVRDEGIDLREVPLPSLLREVAGRFETLGVA